MERIMRCPECEGRGYHWVGTWDDNAERQVCDLCGGAGKGRVAWERVLTAVGLVLAGWGVVALAIELTRIAWIG